MGRELTEYKAKFCLSDNPLGKSRPKSLFARDVAW
jgi:hypothetical protein